MQKDKIFIRFAFTKIDGEFPVGEEFSSDELENPLCFARFFLSWDPGDEGLLDIKILGCTVIYDGISRVKALDMGFYFANGELKGYPSPIFEFQLSNEVDSHRFLRCVWRSGVSVLPLSRSVEGGDPVIFEDHNGYSRVIDAHDLDEMRATLQGARAFSGRVFGVDTLEEGISCLDMAP